MNFFETDEYHAGLGLRVSAPTGHESATDIFFNHKLVMATTGKPVP